MPAAEAVRTLEQVLQEAEIEAFRDNRANYFASLPLWVNSRELPEPPAPPEWLQELIDEE